MAYVIKVEKNAWEFRIMVTSSREKGWDGENCTGTSILSFMFYTFSWVLVKFLLTFLEALSIILKKYIMFNTNF